MSPWVYVRVAAALALREQNEKNTCPGQIGRIFEVYLFRHKATDSVQMSSASDARLASI